MLANDQKYKLVLTYGRYNFYEPTSITEGYHHCRYVEAYQQETYAAAGATKETLEILANEMLARCNAANSHETLRTDIAALTQNLLYRLKNPVDQYCAIRQPAFLLFIEYTTEDGTVISENPDKIDYVLQEKKVRLALDIPEVYTFFLNMGVACISSYKEHLNTLTDDYFFQRDEALRTLSSSQKGGEGF